MARLRLAELEKERRGAATAARREVEAVGEVRRERLLRVDGADEEVEGVLQIVDAAVRYVRS